MYGLFSTHDMLRRLGDVIALSQGISLLHFQILGNPKGKYRNSRFK